jgi:hypothetical protein
MFVAIRKLNSHQVHLGFSIEVTLADILAQIYGGQPLNHINVDDWVPEFEKEHNSILSIYRAQMDQ